MQSQQSHGKDGQSKKTCGHTRDLQMVETKPQPVRALMHRRNEGSRDCLKKLPKFEASFSNLG